MCQRSAREQQAAVTSARDRSGSLLIQIHRSAGSGHYSAPQQRGPDDGVTGASLEGSGQLAVIRLLDPTA